MPKILSCPVLKFLNLKHTRKLKKKRGRNKPIKIYLLKTLICHVKNTDKTPQLHRRTNNFYNVFTFFYTINNLKIH